MTTPSTDTAGRSFFLAGRLLYLIGSLAGGLFFAATASGTDLQKPARLQITIVDEEHRALTGTRVWSHESVAARAESPAGRADRTLLAVDAEGRVDLQRRRPEHAAGFRWRESLRIELDGFVSKEHSIDLFPGAQKQVTVTMLREHETLNRLRGPRDQPLPRVTLYAGHVRGGSMHQELLFTDDQGERRWRHTSLDAGFSSAALSENLSADWASMNGATSQPRYPSDAASSVGTSRGISPKVSLEIASCIADFLVADGKTIRSRVEKAAFG